MDKNHGAGNGGREALPSGAGSSSDSGDGAAKGGKLPPALQQSFGEVQGILEHNRMLIREISQNQESRRDKDALARNATLIRELNTNISRVFGLYSDLSGSFARSVAAKKASDNKAAADPNKPRSNDKQ